MSASAEGFAGATRRESGVLPASERPLKTATSLLEPVRVEVAEDWPGRRTPPGLAARDTLRGGVAVPDEGRPSGDGRRSDLENCKHKGGWQGCELCGRSTTQRCSQAAIRSIWRNGAGCRTFGSAPCAGLRGVRALAIGAARRFVIGIPNTTALLRDQVIEGLDENRAWASFVASWSTDSPNLSRWGSRDRR